MALPAVLGSAATSWSDTGLTAGTHYYYEIEATAGALTSPASNVADDTTVPPTPTGVRVAATSATELDVSWSAAAGATGYLVQKQDAAGWSDVADLDASNLSFHDTGLLDGTNGAYRLTAYNAAGLSSASASATNTSTLTVPLAPSGVQAIALSSGAVQVFWRDASHDETGYRVERSPAGAQAWQSVGTTLPGVSYDYRVFATNAAGDSAPATAAAYGQSGSLTLPTVPVAQAPVGVTASLAGNALTVNWTAGLGTAYQYQIRIQSLSFAGADASPSASPGPQTIDVASGTQATVTLDDSFNWLSPADYYVCVRAVSAGGADSPWSGLVHVGLTAGDPAVTPPSGSPLNFHATGDAGTAFLAFDLPPGVGTVTGVVVTAMGPGLAAPLVTGFHADGDYGINLPEPDSTYSITAKIYNTGGYGGSANATFTTGTFTAPPAIPTDLHATMLSATEADVSWTGTPWSDLLLQAFSDPFGVNQVFGVTIDGSGNSATLTNLPANTPLWLRLGPGGGLSPAQLALTTLSSATAPTALDNDALESGPDGLPQAGALLFTRTGDVNQPVDQPISLAGTAAGSAYNLVDAYTGQIVTGSVNFPAGFSNKVIEVIPINDGTAQWTRTVSVTEGTATNTQSDPTPATVGIEGGNFAITLGNGSDNQILQASSDGTQNLVPLTLTLPTTIVPGATVTLTINSPVGIDVWGTSTPQPGDTPLNGTGTTITWTESADPALAVPTVVWAGATDGSTQISSTWFALTATDAFGVVRVAHPTTTISTTTPDDTIKLAIESLNDPNGDVINGSDVTGKFDRKWLVGQRADLEVVAEAPAPFDFPVSTRWSVSGSVLHQYYSDPLKPTNFDGAPSYPPLPPRLTRTGHSEVSFFWVSTVPGDTGVEADTARVDVEMESGEVYTLYTGFRVSTPTSLTGVLTSTPGIKFSTVDGQWVIGLPGTGTGKADGVIWSASVTNPAPFGEGQWRFLQMINPFWTDWPLGSGPAIPNVHRFWGLDTRDPYDDVLRFNGLNGWLTDGVAHSDGDTPYEGIDAARDAAISMNDSFKTYLMYLPPGQNSGWVPIGRDHWSYYIAVRQVIQSGKFTGVWAQVGTAPVSNNKGFVRETHEPNWTFVHNAGNL